MTDYRREQQSYVSRAGGDEGGQGWDGRTVLREMWGRQERRKTGRGRQETEEGGKDYQMRRWRSCGQHLTPDKGKTRKREPRTVMVICHLLWWYVVICGVRLLWSSVVVICPDHIYVVDICCDETGVCYGCPLWSSLTVSAVSATDDVVLHQSELLRQQLVWVAVIGVQHFVECAAGGAGDETVALPNLFSVWILWVHHSDIIYLWYILVGFFSVENLFSLFWCFLATQVLLLVDVNSTTLILILMTFVFLALPIRMCLLWQLLLSSLLLRCLSSCSPPLLVWAHSL